MNKDLLESIKNAIESLNNRLLAIESDSFYGRCLIESALSKDFSKKKSKSKKQSGTT